MGRRCLRKAGYNAMWSWNTVLEISAGLIVLGLLLAGAYEALGIINRAIPFTPDLPLISAIVRPWVAAHKDFALGLAAVAFAAEVWLFFHFFLLL